MFEALLASAILVGSVEVSPGIIQEQYITNIENVPVLIEFEVDTE